MDINEITTPRQQTEIMSIQELKARYIRFCLNHELDHTASPASQVDLVADDQSRNCLLRLIDNMQKAKDHGVIFARHKITQLRSLYASLSENGLSDFKDAYNFDNNH